MCETYLSRVNIIGEPITTSFVPPAQADCSGVELVISVIVLQTALPVVE